MGPSEAGRVCDFLSMHGYPMYLRWAESADNEKVLPFLGLLTQWLGGRDVLFEEFGAPSAKSLSQRTNVPILADIQAALFIRRALESLHRVGFLGSMLWCYADYDTSLWRKPPLDQLPHERHFGLWGRGYAPKPALVEVRRFAGMAKRRPFAKFNWIDIPPEEFYEAPQENLQRLYPRFRKWYARKEVQCAQ